MVTELPQDLVDHLVRTSGLPAPTAARLAADVLAYFDDTVEDYVRRRHGQLRLRGQRNDLIWQQLLAELPYRRFRAPAVSDRQLRRMVYG